MTKWALFLQPVENSGNFFPLQHQSPSNLQQSQIQKQLSTFSPFLSLSFFFSSFSSLTNIFSVFFNYPRRPRGLGAGGGSEKRGGGGPERTHKTTKETVKRSKYINLRGRKPQSFFVSCSDSFSRCCLLPVSNRKRMAISLAVSRQARNSPDTFFFFLPPSPFF